jgi:hypothetical protein
MSHIFFAYKDFYAQLLLRAEHRKYDDYHSLIFGSYKSYIYLYFCFIHTLNFAVFHKTTTEFMDIPNGLT